MYVTPINLGVNNHFICGYPHIYHAGLSADTVKTTAGTFLCFGIVFSWHIIDHIWCFQLCVYLKRQSYNFLQTNQKCVFGVSNCIKVIFCDSNVFSEDPSNAQGMKACLLMKYGSPCSKHFILYNDEGKWVLYNDGGKWVLVSLHI